ncbi:RAMP superfamily CRISPR-associated protein [Leptolyngbya sp. O-77]|uniref:RAMP superfamily CRISPR-associated protein n=1 Tax=Leptolyngbya sp. O-77 TaxID=1080068 RepID=UPI00074D4279|nr:RAMP superfamily CRISPR-associated protein [Leptolyngbya sp. O-77]BAU44926.1 RAMP superfamily protein [Leptolyngbya sp. O-77]
MVQLSSLSQVQTEIPLTAVIDSALCVGAGGSTGPWADKPIVRLADGRLLIPGSQLKGRLRHECEKLARALGWPVCESPVAETMCPQIGRDNSEFQRTAGEPQHHCLICQIFGNPALPSRLIVDDLICLENSKDLPEVLRPGVTINRRRRTAEDQKLYFLETSPVNVQLPFVGHLYFQPDCPPYARALVLAALHHIPALGGSKSAGLGWLTWQIGDIDIDQSAWESLKVGNAP